MRRVIVPLDGTKLAESILPDAQRLAGEGGELVLVRDISTHLPPLRVWEYYDSATWRFDGEAAARDARQYLQAQIQLLRSRGVNVRAHTPILTDIALSIDEAARVLDADMIVCATHGRGPMGRLLRGGVAWRALAQSSVPIMLRHIEEQEEVLRVDASGRRILVPLDGSARSETALPVAVELAEEWNASLYLMRVVSTVPVVDMPLATFGMVDADSLAVDRRLAQEYLDDKGRELPVVAHTYATLGSITGALLQAVEDWGITDIVMASHGRTGLMRVILGSVADALIHRLTCPVIVIPSLAAEPLEAKTEETGAVPAHA